MLSAVPLSLLLVAAQLLQPAAAIDCKKIKTGDKYWNINALEGDYEVNDYEPDTPVGAKNTTYSFNLCKPIQRHDDKKFRNGCPMGAWACAFQTIAKEKEDDERHSWPIAGNFETSNHGAPLDDKQDRLSNSGSHEDAQKEGLRLEYRGGKGYSVNDPAMMIVELICKRDADEKARRDDDDGEKNDSKKDGPQLVSYKSETSGDKIFEVLRIKWESSHACEDESDSDDSAKKPSSGWGFFTWIIIVLFLLVAAYLIFGSWLNYNRHGARGWDLLPHGDTIRDIPYLLKDWGRRMVDTVKGDNRGGYNQI